MNGAITRLLPRRSDYAGLRFSWRADIVAGVTVAVVALPLALALSITTGLGAEAGLITGIVAGLVAAVFGGSNVQVSGTSGAMTVVLVPLVQRYGPEAVYLVGLMAGVLVVAASFARLGRFLAFIPWPVIEGFTLGIAAIIFLQQVPLALGVATPEGDNTALVAARAVGDALDAGSLAAMTIVLLVAVVMVVTPKLHRAVPGSLVAVAVATIAAIAADLDVASIGSLPSSLPIPSLPNASLGRISELFPAAFAIALLVALESLLSAKVADGMTTDGRHDPDRELFGQGLANLTAPLFGGMPATGVIARTAVNVRAGARTRVSSVVHALVLLLVVLFAGGIVGRIPLAALAGVLMVTAVRMVHLYNITAVLRSTRSDALVLIVTAASTIIFDLIVAVEIGVAVAAVLALRHMARSSVAEREELSVGVVEGVGRIVSYRLDGALFFGAAQRLASEITAVGGAEVVILRMPRVQLLDATGAQALSEIVTELEGRGITVLIKGVRPEHLPVLRAVGALDNLAHEKHLFGDLDSAVAHAHRHVHRDATQSVAAKSPLLGVAELGSDAQQIPARHDETHGQHDRAEQDEHHPHEASAAS